jgi:hypothetical protein
MTLALMFQFTVDFKVLFCWYWYNAIKEVMWVQRVLVYIFTYASLQLFLENTASLFQVTVPSNFIVRKNFVCFAHVPVLIPVFLLVFP